MEKRSAPRVTRLLIARHGQTVSNREGRFCGHSETDLTPLGEQQAAALARRLDRIELHAAYTSDYSRAMRTAAAVLEGRGLTPAVDAALRELHYGEWEMQRESEIRRRDPDQHRLMRAEDPAWHPPGGENVAMVRARTYASLQRIARTHRGQNVLIVSHGTAINCLLAEVLGIPPEATFRLVVANCGLSEIDIVGSRTVVSLLNETAHLAGIESPA